MTDDHMQPGTLHEEQRATARRRILTAARRAIAEHGLGVTVDQIALAAGVGRRTVFRYFANRELLLNTALEEWASNIQTRLPMQPAAGQPADGWLLEVAAGVMGANLELGQLYWEFHGPKSRLAETNPGVYEVIRSFRTLRATEICTSAWTAFGGTGRPPAWAIDVFAVQLSVFVSAFLGELGRTEQQVIRAVAASLEAVVRHALTEAADAREI